MKSTLMFFRHAKSSWSNVSLSDRERPLNKRGKHDAPMMGKRLNRAGYRCDLLISSPAIRALSTARSVAKEIGYSQEKILLEKSLYMADIEDYLDVISRVDEKVKHLMLVSHNPGSEEIVEHFTSEQFAKFPTAAYALIEIEGNWSEIRSSRLLHFDFPKSTIG